MATGQARMLDGDGPDGAAPARGPVTRRLPTSRTRAPAPSAAPSSSAWGRPPPSAATSTPQTLRGRGERRDPSPGRDADGTTARFLEDRPATVAAAPRQYRRVRPVAPDRSTPDGANGARTRGMGVRIAIAGPLAILFVVLATGAFMDARNADLALPGVHVEGKPVDGMNATAISSLVRALSSDLVASPVTFTHAGRTWRPTGAEVGLKVDGAAMGEAALTLGRQWPWPLRWLSVVATPAWRPAVPFRASVEHATLSSYLERLATSVDRAPVEPSVSIRTGQVQVVPGVPGERVDVGATSRAVRVPGATSDRQVVPLAVVNSPPRIPAESAAEAQRHAQRILAAPLSVRAGDKSWVLSLAQLEQMLEFRREVGSGGDRLVASLSETALAAFVRTIAQQVDRAPQDGQIRWDGKAIVFVKDGLDGQQLDQAAAVRTLVDGASSDSRDVVLPVKVAPTTVSSARLAARGIRELIGTGTSKFAGSPPERANNVKVAASKLHHQVIAPGSIFSFLEALGPITAETGYLEGLTIQGDATVPGIGGGVCQVSTTLFRAAFYAGLPIVERHQHVYRVSYYEQDGSPPGFDAAVYDPGVDFRFRNDTGSPLLIDVSVDQATSTVAFRLFGETTGRDVKLGAARANEKPSPAMGQDVADPKLDFGLRKQVEWKATGVDATIRRTIAVAGKPGTTDTFASRYVPWQEKWSIGTGPVTLKTPPTVKAAIAEGAVSPGTPGAIVALRALLSPPLPVEGADSSPQGPGDRTDPAAVAGAQAPGSRAPAPPGLGAPAPAAVAVPAGQVPAAPASVSRAATAPAVTAPAATSATTAPTPVIAPPTPAIMPTPPAARA